jgi:methyl-accepting chemotaxis protein
VDSGWVLTVFVIVTAIAFCAQAIILVFLYKAINQSSARIENIAERMEKSALPVLTAAGAILDDAQPKMAEITSNLAEASSMIRANVATVAEATGEIVERARMQAARLDEVIHSTVDKVEQTTDYLQNSVIRPVRRVHAIVQALNAGFSFFKHARAAKKGAQLAAEEDEEMFI